VSADALRLGDGPFATVLTGEGRGAIAVVRVWGPGGVEAVSAVFRPTRPGPWSASPVGKARLGSIIDPATGAEGDQVVAVVLSADPPEVEVHGHAGVAAIASIRSALQAVGVRLVTPSRWLRDHAPSRIAAHAMEDLPHATTTRAASILLDQAVGALDRELIGLIDKEDQHAIKTLIGRGALGVRLLAGWRVVLAGRPNVGKSRLLNALAGFDRVIVHERPGTTRDVVSVPLALDGWPVEVSDTAGLRETTEVVEAAGVARAARAQREADLVLLVLDRSETLSGDDRVLLARFPKALRIASKVDLEAAWDAETVDAVPVSAASGDGVDALIAAIVSRLVPDRPEPGAGVPFRDAHLRRLRTLQSCLEAGRVSSFQRRVAAWTRPRGPGHGTGPSVPL
jgi:tRNA modification GTPase